MSSIFFNFHKYWPFGGAEFATHLILKMLRDEGFDITVFSGIRSIARLHDARESSISGYD